MIKHALLIAALLGAGCAAAPSAPLPLQDLAPTRAAVDAAGSRLEALTLLDQSACTADGQWCLHVGEDRTIAAARHGGGAHAGDAISIEPRDRATARPWPFVVRRADSSAEDRVLLGVLWETTSSYSGGGASETNLVLYELSSDRATPVLELLVAGEALIRACFSQADVAARREACHDEYAFEGALSLDETTSKGGPRLAYQTRAATFPGPVTRSDDSSERGRLSPEDLHWARDEACTLTRWFVWDAPASALAPNEPLPDCMDYRAQ